MGAAIRKCNVQIAVMVSSNVLWVLRCVTQMWCETEEPVMGNGC